MSTVLEDGGRWQSKKETAKGDVRLEVSVQIV